MSPERPVDLFESSARDELSRRAPLAERMRPKRLEDVVGQRELLGEKGSLRHLIEADRLSSAVFFGPPGTGKTTVARLVAELSRKRFVQLSATTAGVKDVREVMADARRELGERGRGTILFLDEVHRFSRTQQDALLPWVEDGTVVLIGATTENPFFALTAPLLSRSTLFRFVPIETDELVALVERAAALEGALLSPDAARACAGLAEGDARAALSTLEVAVALARAASKVPTGVEVTVEMADVDRARTTRALRFGADEHFDMTSAFIKSIRGSDPDAGVYWLVRLIAAGEDPRFLARRLVILASEDIGLADPMALVVATSAASALDRVGLPEASLNLAQCVVYLALSPKSNRVAEALWRAERDVQNEPLGSVPAAIRDAHYRGASELGHGVGYEYPHDDDRGYVEAVYLPAALAERRYYEPSEHGAEKELARAWQERRRPRKPVDNGSDGRDEVST